MSDEQTTEREEVLGPLRKQYGDNGIAYWDVPGFGLVVAAAPENDAAFGQFVNDTNNPKLDKFVTLRTFAAACIVHPDRDTAKKLLKAKPAFAIKVATRGQELCGSEIQELGKD